MKKVVVGMSGGVDSAVSALFLKNKGYEVIGITFKLLEDFDCTKAIETAKKIGIEHHIIDLVDVFKNEVIDKFQLDYKNGLTPNPCVICNKKIKFKYMEEARQKYNADYIATGHYAKIEDGVIKKSKYIEKDQSYFISSIDKDLIDKLIFPLEDMTKEMVRQIALENDLPSAKEKDSFDVCFIQNKTFREYIESILTNKPGNIINVETKEVIGKHEGLFKYTIGQRKNVGLSGDEERHYVCGKNIKDNILYVAYGDSKYLYSDKCLIEDVNMIVDYKPINCSAKFRYRGEEYPVVLKYLDNDMIEVSYPSLIKNVTPGQFCVLYDDDKCLGCGTIKTIYKNNEELWYLK